MKELKDIDNSNEELLKGDKDDYRINASSRLTDLQGANKVDDVIGGYKAQNNEESKVQLSPYRHIIVTIYCLLNILNGAHWITFASCGAKFGKYFHLNNYLVDLFSLIFMILYPIGFIPEAYIIDNISMRVGLNISASLIIIGSFLKIFINYSIIFAYVGQFFTAVFQPAILNSPGKIASTWYNEKSRTLVTSICCVSNTIGVMIGYLFHGFFIDENMVNPRMWRKSFEDYLFFEFIFSLFFGLIFLIFMRNKPQFPPSLSQSNYQPLSLKEGMKSLLSNKDFMKILLSLACIIGFANIFGTIFNSYMALYKIKDSVATYTVASANLMGILVALGVGIIVDKSKQYKTVMIIFNLLSLIFLILITIILESVGKNLIEFMSFIFYILVIATAVPIYTTGMDYVCEITYPVGESISEGMIMCANQIMGVVGIAICDSFRTYLSEYRFLTNLFCIILFVISGICLFLINPNLKRTQKDLGNKK